MVGDHVLLVRVRRSETKTKFVSTWTGPWRTVTGEIWHVYEVQSIVTGEVHDVHVAHLRFHAEKELEITADLKKVLEHAVALEEFEMAAIFGKSEEYAGDGFYA